MGWDSNPREALTSAGFQDRSLQPLGHPSVFVFLHTFYPLDHPDSVVAFTDRNLAPYAAPKWGAWALLGTW